MQNNRKYYLDWIRVIIVLVLIPFHSAVSFSHIGKAYIYTKTPIDSFLYIFISDFFNLWFMRTLFFISGIAAYYSFKSNLDFVIGRTKRLLLPVLFTLIIVGPISGYFIYIGKTNGSFIDFYPQFFLNPQKYLFWSHMWYCVYLYTFSVLFSPILNVLKFKPVFLNRINSFLAQRKNILIPAILVMVIEILLRPDYPGFQKLIGDWANVAVYVTFFLIGYIVAGNTKCFESIKKNINNSMVLAVLSTSVYIILRRFAGYENIPYVINLLWGLAAYSWTLLVVGIGYKYMNFKNSILDYLSKVSFSFYIFHYLIVTFFNYIFIKMNISHYLTWLLSIIFSFITLSLVFEVIVKRNRLLRLICGVK